MSVFRTLIRAYLKPDERFFLFSEHATLVLVIFVIKILAFETSVFGYCLRDGGCWFTD